MSAQTLHCPPPHGIPIPTYSVLNWLVLLVFVIDHPTKNFVNWTSCSVIWHGRSECRMTNHGQASNKLRPCHRSSLVWHLGFFVENRHISRSFGDTCCFTLTELYSVTWNTSIGTSRLVHLLACPLSCALSFHVLFCILGSVFVEDTLKVQSTKQPLPWKRAHNCIVLLVTEKSSRTTLHYVIQSYGACDLVLFPSSCSSCSPLPPIRCCYHCGGAQ